MESFRHKSNLILSTKSSLDEWKEALLALDSESTESCYFTTKLQLFKDSLTVLIHSSNKIVIEGSEAALEDFSKLFSDTRAKVHRKCSLEAQTAETTRELEQLNLKQSNSEKEAESDKDEDQKVLPIKKCNKKERGGK